jgi:biopolymer transport protein TolR
MAMTTGGGSGFRAEMNVTPMIDVLLVLLVIFMVVAPMKPEGLPALVPQPPAPDNRPAPMNDLVLTVRGDGAVALNQETVTLQELRERLAEIFKFRGDRVVFVRGEGGLDFAQVAKVMDIARGAGMTRIGLMTTAAQ